MSAASLAAATAITARVAAIDSQIAGWNTRIAAIEATLTENQRSGIEAEWLDECLRWKTIKPLILISRMFPDNATVLAQKGSVWLGLRARKLQEQRRRAAYVDFAVQCTDERIYSFVPAEATAAEIETKVVDMAQAYVLATTDDEVSLALIGKKLINGG